MYELVLQKQKEKLYIIMFIGFFIGFGILFYILDYLNGGYNKMTLEYGVYLTIINIVLNIIMSLMSARMFNLSQALSSISNKDSKASNIPILSIIFGIFTYGCTSCVITFLATLGIAFSVPALGLMGLPYKLLSFGLLLIGYFFVVRSIKKNECRVKL